MHTIAMLHTCTSSVFIITNLYAEKFGHKGLTPGEMQDLRSCTFHGGGPIFLTLFYPVKVSLPPFDQILSSSEKCEMWFK